MWWRASALRHTWCSNRSVRTDWVSCVCVVYRVLGCGCVGVHVGWGVTWHAISSTRCAEPTLLHVKMYKFIIYK